MIKIETKRLRLREFTLDDGDAFFAMNENPVVMRYFPSPMTREGSDHFLSRIIDYYAENDGGYWAAETKDGGFIGLVGITNVNYETPFTPAIEIGWRLIPSAWGFGYASEAARACLRYGFETMELAEIVAMTAVQNTPSQKVMQRIGMSHDPADDFDHPRVSADCHVLRHVLYRISREQWVATSAR